MSDQPLTIEIPLFEPSEFDNLEGDALKAARLKLVDIASKCEDPFALIEIEAIAKGKLGVPLPGWRQLIKSTRKAREDAATEERRVKAEAEGAKAVALGGSDPLVFDGKSYFRREKDNRFGALCREDAILHLGIHGFNTKRDDGEMSPADRALYELQTNNRVTFAGPLCGRPAGIYEENGMRLLCTAGPIEITPSKGDFPTIQSYLSDLFGSSIGDEHFPRQFSTIIAWIKLGREAVKNHEQSLPGQILMLVGPPDCGKSMFQKMILTPAFGGRVGDPGLWLTGQTPFNEGMWAAEHLALGDKALRGDGRMRDELRDAMKELVASPEYPFHPKGKTGHTFRPIWRMSMTANMDPESISHIPGISGGFEDKVIVARVYSPPAPLWDPEDRQGRFNFNKRIAAEMPAFLHFVDTFEVPADVYKGRFGVAEFHHPEVVELIDGNDPLRYLEEILFNWVDGVSASPDSDTVKKGYVQRTTSALFAELEGDARALSGKRISSGISHFGHQMVKLSERPKWVERMRKVRTDGPDVWRFDLPKTN